MPSPRIVSISGVPHPSPLPPTSPSPRDPGDVSPSAVAFSWVPAGTTREIRAFNIFGVSSSRFTHMYGQKGEDNLKGDHLAIMPDFEKGFHAAIDLIRQNYLTLGCFVPFVLGNKWAGDKTQKYGVSLAKVMKADPLLPLNFKKAGDTLLRAMAIMENGDPCRNIPRGYFERFIQTDA